MFPEHRFGGGWRRLTPRGILESGYREQAAGWDPLLEFLVEWVHFDRSQAGIPAGWGDMQIVFRCPRCRNANRAASVENSDAVRCAHCDWVRPIAADEISNGLPTRCLACGCQDLWRQKDFP